MWLPKLDPEKPKHTSLLLELHRAIASGVLKQNEPLPPQRQLAYALNVNLSTVTRAFKEASAQGLIGGEIGRGTFVLPVSDAKVLFANSTRTENIADLTQIAPIKTNTNLIRDSLQTFSVSDFNEAERYPSHDVLLRAESAAREWSTWRGDTTRNNDVVIGPGAHALLTSLLSLVVKPGESILVEAFTFPGIKQAAANLQIKLIGVKCDAYGLNPQALEAAISNHDVRYLVCTPNLQNPTGVTMDTVRRRQIADIVERTQMTLIEDDVYGSFTNQPPLSAETKGDHFCVSSLSKCVTPGLRFGFVTGSCDALAGLKQEVSMTSWLVAPFMLTLATKLIESGKAMDAANNQKALIQARSDMAVKIFGKKLDGPATHLWLETPYDSEAFSDFIYAKGIKVLPSTNFRVGRGGKTHIRVSLSADISNSELAWSLNLIAQNGAKLT